MKRLHDQYRGVVRIAPDELSDRNEEAWKDIYGLLRKFPREMRFCNVSKRKAPSVVAAPDNVFHG